MKILFVHQNFPGQFPHLAPALRARGHNVLALTDDKNNRPSPVKVVKYQSPTPPVDDMNFLLKSHADHVARGYLAARGARALRDQHGYTPDCIYVHPGWGEGLFLREIWPDARILSYAELMYPLRPDATPFDPEFPIGKEEVRMAVVARGLHLLHGVVSADAAVTPTRYQHSTFPPELQGKIKVMHDGIDTDLASPKPDAELTLPNGRTLRKGDPVISYVARGLEPYRGFHVFMRALPEVLNSCPDAQIVLIGRDEVSYGTEPTGAANWREKMLAELEGQLDLERVHMIGQQPHSKYLNLLRISRAHCYLTYPFVLSWSLTEAMSVGCNILASDTAPVCEVIDDGVHGTLINFHDVAGWSRAMITALSGETTEELSRRKAARARMVAEYDLQTICLPRLIEWVETEGAPRA